MAVTALSPAHAQGVVKRGEEIAVKHCSRCHVIGDRNRFGGIDSTPSFPLLVRRDDYRERFQSFYERRPHPVFVRVKGVPAWSDALPNAAPFELVPKDIDDILAFIETLREK